MKKLNKIVLSVLVLVIVSGVAYCNPFKVTDPSDPRFNPENFKFSDYKAKEDIENVFRKIFPIGSEKKNIDEILGNAIETKPTAIKFGTSPNIFWQVKYTEPYNPFRQLKQSVFYIFIFDEDNKLKNIHINSQGKVYPNSWGVDEYYKANRG